MPELPEVETVIVPGKSKDLSVWVQSNVHANKLAILLPGFLDSADYPHLRDLSARLSQLGYVCVRFDPPGTWTNGEDINDYNITNYVQAVVDAHAWAKRTFNVPRCVLIGHSFGGVVSLVAARKLSDVAAVVAIMAPERLSVAVKWPPGEVRKGTRQYPNDLKISREFAVPYTFAQDIDHYDIPTIIASLKCPSLFIAGELDTVVIPTEVEKLAGLAQQGRYLLINDIQHGYWKMPQQVNTVHGAVIKFLREEGLA
jgi:pimeloyl-ACP methyl ester carboxylesterase